MGVKKVKVSFEVHVQEEFEPNGSRFTEGRLRNELSLFAQHLLEAYDETILDAQVNGEPIKYPLMS